jgi:hypothetical protein
MVASGAPEHESDAVRFVSGLAAIPSGIRRIDGYAPELFAGILLVLVVVLVFWIW